MVDVSPVPPAAPAGDYVLATLRELLAAIRAHEPGVRLGTDPEEVHMMRTSVRRLRAVLRAVRPMSARRFAAQRDELRWLGAALGTVRDLDVLNAYLKTTLRTLKGGERTVARRALTHFEKQRAKANDEARAALDSPQYTALLDGMEEALQHPHIVDWDASLEDIAAGHFKKVRRAVKALSDPPDDEALHQVRIKLKRARYTAELAQPIVGRRAERFVAKASALQDLLGEHQDAKVAEARLRQFAAGVKGRTDRAAMKRLLERQRRRRLAAWEAFQDQWPKLRRRGRKAWT